MYVYVPASRKSDHLLSPYVEPCGIVAGLADSVQLCASALPRRPQRNVVHVCHISA
jgi:hypothetical protein